MADDRLRELERRFRESGSPSDEAAWIKAALRAGSLQRERVELAAYLDHPPARAALELTSEEPPRLRSPLEQHLKALERWAPIVSVRVALAAARADEHGEQAALDVLERAEAWVVDPDACASRLNLPRSLLQALVELRTRSQVVRAAVHAFQAAVCIAGREWDAESAVSEAIQAAMASASLSGRGLVGEGSVIAAVRAELIPWALGQGDPVKTRVQGRQGNVKTFPEDLEA